MSSDWMSASIGSVTAINPASSGVADDGSVSGDEPFSYAVRARRWLLGTVVSSPDPVLGERIAQSFDFVWIDFEHSALGVREAQMLAIAAKAGGAAALVRVARWDSELLAAVLDAGVDGIVSPKLESARDAERLVDAMRYPPDGRRGFAPRRASGGMAMRRAGPPDIACLVQIETRRGIANADAIAAVDGVDGLVVGTADLSFDLGSPLNLGSPELASAIAAVRDAAIRSQKAWGVAVGDLPVWADDLRADGASLLVFSSDARIYSEAVERCRERLQALERDPAASADSHGPDGRMQQGSRRLLSAQVDPARLE
jgi:4-hydroxy-2-oxoheptanedioate aldolase